MHRLGLDIVRERLMHAHYGIEKAIPFEFGKSPMSFMSVGPDGVMRCTGVMHWYAHMVSIGESKLNRRTKKFLMGTKLFIRSIVRLRNGNTDSQRPSTAQLNSSRVQKWTLQYILMIVTNLSLSFSKSSCSEGL